MNRSIYFNYIEEKLNTLATRIVSRGKLNLLELNIHSEGFYQDFVNLLFDWKLENLNAIKSNSAGIIIDTTNKIVVQVSSVATKQKIEAALSKDLSKQKDFSFKFISISKDAAKLRQKTYKNPYNLNFSPSYDIFDILSLLSIIKDLEISKLKEVYEFIKKELRSEPDPDLIETNLATIIKTLANEDWGEETLVLETIPFDIEKKIAHNELDRARDIIDSYKIHYHRIENIYKEFDKQGVNKSTSILNKFRTVYKKQPQSSTQDREVFCNN